MDGELLERFITGRDEDAFAALVDRHGPMVLGVCRLVMGDVHDAEDAFQAAFLLLARNAGRIKKRDALASWLYGVAYRVAVRARADAARRHARERPIGEVQAVDAGDDPGGRELRAALHAEVNRLPEAYRAPIVLCYLEGHTHEEAARALRWPVGSVKGRLARARRVLRARLAHFESTEPATLCVTTLGRDRVAVPERLKRATVEAALRLLAGADGAVSRRVDHGPR